MITPASRSLLNPLWLISSRIGCWATAPLRNHSGHTASVHRPKASTSAEACRNEKVVAFVNPEECASTVDHYYRPLYLFALSLARNEHDAWDLTHDTFLKWVAHQHRIRDRARTKTWLFTTLYRQFLDHARRRSRHASLEDDEGTHAAAVPSNAGPALVPDARALDHNHVLTLLQALPEKYRAALTLFYLEECSYKEISRILGIRMGTVMSRLARGRLLLAERLEAPPTPQHHET